MDQDSFRTMLSQPSAGPSQSSRYAKKQTKKTISASEPAFKPRKVKKEGKYRDRAAERRDDNANDYAQVEAILAEIEKKDDTTEPVLVKGLDIALLEENKLKATVSATAEEDLDELLAQVPKKRTREDIVRELKEKRSKGPAPPADAPINSKFKPVGFKPIGASAEGTSKKKKKKTADGEPKKKKRKVDATQTEKLLSELEPTDAVPSKPVVAAEPEPLEDIDIFADAGDYEGLNIDEDDDDGDKPRENQEQAVSEALSAPARWFDDDPPEPTLPTKAQTPLKPLLEAAALEEGEAEEDDTPMRLVPLEGSSSVKEMLALDQAAGADEKRRKRKEKSKSKKDATGDGKLSTAAKVDRDYQRLKSYQEKKESAK